MNTRSQSRHSSLSIISIICFNFASFIGNGLPLAVLPSYVLNTLGFSSAFTGAVLGSQYLATLLSRPLAGRLADSIGAKHTVMAGLAGLALSGAVTSVALITATSPMICLCLLVTGRILQGLSSALISTPCCTWAIALSGTSRTAQVMSWNGIAAYGGTALGAPLGVFIVSHWGMTSIGVAITLLGLLPLLFARSRPTAPLMQGVRLPFHSVFMAVLPNGLAVACSSVGFGSLTAFVALYFDSLGWVDAAYCLTAFGTAFIFARLVSPNVLSRFGGYPVVCTCMAVQSLGLLLIGLAPSPLIAILGAALTGLGVSWVYPGLAVETLARTPQANRNSALSTLSLFFDLAVGLAGPLMGLVAASFGLTWIFFCAALLSIIGCVLLLHRQSIHH